MDQLLAKIVGGKRRVASTSLKVYRNQIDKMSREFHGRNFQDVSDFYAADDICKYLLENKSPATIRARISAILVALAPEDFRTVPTLIKAKQAHGIYSVKLREMLVEKKKDMENQVMSPRIAKNWTTMDCLRQVQKEWKEKAEAAMKDKTSMAYSEYFQLVQNYVISSLYVLDNFPRRNEYADMRVIRFEEFHKNLDDTEKEKCNWLVYCESPKFKDRMSFHFYKFKTRRKFGVQVIPVRPELCKVLNMWLNVNQSGWLLLNKSMKKLSRNYLAIRLPQIFKGCGKTIGSQMIRHIFITEEFEGDSTHRQRRFLSDQMGHTVTCQQLTYRKISE